MRRRFGARSASHPEKPRDNAAIGHAPQITLERNSSGGFALSSRAITQLVMLFVAMSVTQKIAAILVADVFSYAGSLGCTVLMQALSYGSSSGSRTSTSGLI